MMMYLRSLVCRAQGADRVVPKVPFGVVRKVLAPWLGSRLSAAVPSLLCTALAALPPVKALRLAIHGG